MTLLQELQAPSPPGRMPLIHWVEHDQFRPRGGRLCPLAGVPNQRGELCRRCRLACKAEARQRRWWPEEHRTAQVVDRLWQTWRTSLDKNGRNAQVTNDTYWRWTHAERREAFSDWRLRYYGR